MWLEAIITQEELVQILDEFLPVKIHLDNDNKTERWISLGRATEVVLVPDEGLHVLCPAQLCWSIAGMSPTVTLDPLAILIRPEMVEKEKGYVLEFQFEIEQADIHGLPDFIDSTLVKAVNSSLSVKRFAWNFTKTLSFSVDMPESIQPPEKLKLGVGWGKRRISSEALILGVSFKLGFAREALESESDAPEQQEAMNAELFRVAAEHKGESRATTVSP